MFKSPINVRTSVVNYPALTETNGQQLLECTNEHEPDMHNCVVCVSYQDCSEEQGCPDMSMSF